MAQPDYKLLINLNSYLIATGLMAVLCISQLLSGNFLAALLSGLVSVVLASNRIEHRGNRELASANAWLKKSTVALAAITLVGLAFDSPAISAWLYIVPLLIFFCFEFKPALRYVGGFSVVAMILLHGHANLFETIQLELNYILYLGISCSLVYLREVRRRQLKPLRRTDNLTKAASREHLDDDLTKEVQRSEREGSELAVMALAIDPIHRAKLTNKEQDSLTIELGKLLHNNLRIFDSYYLWEHHEFLIVLPHTSSAQAVKIANSLRVKIRKEITFNNESITVSVGVSGLNVGDSSDELTSRAAKALQETQGKGNNRTQLYREDISASSKEDQADDTQSEDNGSDEA